MLLANSWSYSRKRKKTSTNKKSCPNEQDFLCIDNLTIH